MLVASAPMKMRRWIAVLLLLIVPLQLSWGAVSGYCLHEDGNAPRHFGHHVHQHADAAGKSSDAKALGGVDSDCAGCHLNGAIALLTSVIEQTIAGVTSDVDSTPSVLPASRAVQPPERPQWSRLA